MKCSVSLSSRVFGRIFSATAKNRTNMPTRLKSSAAHTTSSVDLYPIDTPVESLANYQSVKKVHFIRHAEGTHNLNDSYREARNFDARLTDTGIQQCKSLAGKLESHHPNVLSAELIVTSPLTRCIQTTLFSMEPILQETTSDNAPPIVAVESLRETMNYISDKRRPISEVATEFPMIDFSIISSETDDLWEYYEEKLGSHEDHITHRESAELYKVANRGREFFEWLVTRNEKNVVVCGHSAFFHCIWNYGLADELPTYVVQSLDTRAGNKEVKPVVNFMGDTSFQEAMQSRYENCELRSKIVAFK